MTYPARTIGGDYFDFISLDNHKLAVCLGDVSGKGLPAALLMANLQASLRSQTYNGISVSECISRCNRHLFQSTSPEKFATLFYGILDVEKHTLTYCNAGHEPPFFMTAGRGPARFSEGGLVIYSDGVSEAMNGDREQFGEKRLLELLEKERDATARELVDRVVQSVRTHAGTAPQYDDITTLVVRRETA